MNPLGTARLRLGLAAPALDAWPLPAVLLDDAREDRRQAAYLAWEVSRWPRGLGDEERGALLRLVYGLLVGFRDGSTCLPLDEPSLAERITGLGLGAQEGRATLALARRLAAGDLGPLGEIVGRPGDRRPLIVDGGALTSERLRAAEEQVAAAIVARLAGDLARPPADAVERAIEEIATAAPRLRGRPIAHTAEQLSAVRLVSTSPLVLVAGRPGSGKTTVVVSMLRALVRLGVPPTSIALAAPTGKAAQRMTAAVVGALRAIPERPAIDEELLAGCARPLTLHRLLAYSPTARRFRHHRGNPLAERCVVVDECSMIDLGLMARLLDALRPDARLVLIGDPDQLPSVDPGAVFRDLVGAGASPGAMPEVAVHLGKSFRVEQGEGAGILAFADAVRRGDAAGAQLPAQDAFDPGSGPGIERLPGARREEVLAAWRGHLSTGDAAALARQPFVLGPSGFRDDDLPRLARLFSLGEERQILCVTRVAGRGTGSEAVNRILHRPLGPGRFHPGEPVMVWRNDYQLGLFNGDRGMILPVVEAGRAAPRWMAVFPREGSFAAFDPDVLRDDLDLAHAVTVHKAQGSEFDHVLLLLPDRDIPLLGRELLYTAVTRARRRVTIVGDQPLLDAAVHRPSLRRARLGERIAARRGE